MDDPIAGGSRPYHPSPGALGGGCGKALAVGRRGGHIPVWSFCRAALNHKGALPSHYEGGSGVKKKEKKKKGEKQKAPASYSSSSSSHYRASAPTKEMTAGAKKREIMLIK